MEKEKKVPLTAPKNTPKKKKKKTTCKIVAHRTGIECWQKA